MARFGEKAVLLLLLLLLGASWGVGLQFPTHQAMLYPRSPDKYGLYVRGVVGSRGRGGGG